MRRLLNITLSAARTAAFSLVIPFSITVVGTFFLEYSGGKQYVDIFYYFFCKRVTKYAQFTDKLFGTKAEENVAQSIRTTKELTIKVASSMVDTQAPCNSN